MTISQGKVEVHVMGNSEKIELEIADYGGLDGSPPDGASISLSTKEALSLANLLKNAVEAFDASKDGGEAIFAPTRLMMGRIGVGMGRTPVI